MASYRNTLRICPKYNDMSVVSKVSPHSHEKFVFQCTQCLRREIRRNDNVVHARATTLTGCRYCSLNKMHERQLYRLIHDHELSTNEAAFEYTFIQHNLTYVRKKKRANYFCDMMYRGIVIELDDESHRFVKTTLASDAIKMKYCSEMNIPVIRIRLKIGDEFTQDLEKQIIDTIEQIKHDKPGFKIYILNDDDGKLGKIMDKYR